MGINEKISALRKSNNMTQAELGTKLNVTFQAVSKWESGKSYPDFETLSKMAKIFGVPISYFEDGGENVTETAALIFPSPFLKQILTSRKPITQRLWTRLSQTSKTLLWII